MYTLVVITGSTTTTTKFASLAEAMDMEAFWRDLGALCLLRIGDWRE